MALNRGYLADVFLSLAVEEVRSSISLTSGSIESVDTFSGRNSTGVGRAVVLRGSHGVVNVSDVIDNATANDSDDSSAEELSEYLFYVVLYKQVVPTIFFFIIVVGIIGNSLVVGVTLSRRQMRSSTVSLLLLNLAVSDLLFLIICVPFMTYHFAGDNWLAGKAACKLAQYTLYVTVYVTVYTLVAIAVLRFVRIVCWPHRQTVSTSSRRTIGIIVAGIWVTMLTINVPLLIFYDVKTYISDNPDHEPYHYCALTSHETIGPWLFGSFFVMAYVCPLTVIATMYVLILRFLRTRRHRHSLFGSQSLRSVSSTSSHRRRRNGWRNRSGTSTFDESSVNIGGGSLLGERRGATLPEQSAGSAGGAVLMSRDRRRTSYATRVFLAVVVVFGVCWLPLHANLLAVYFFRQPDSRLYAVIRVVCHSLAYANSSVNPLIYHYVSADFRRSVHVLLTAAVSLLRRRFRCLLRASPVSTEALQAAAASMTRNRSTLNAGGRGVDPATVHAANARGDAAAATGSGGAANKADRSPGGAKGACCSTGAFLTVDGTQLQTLLTSSCTEGDNAAITTHVEMYQLPTRHSLQQPCSLNDEPLVRNTAVDRTSC